MIERIVGLALAQRILVCMVRVLELLAACARPYAGCWGLSGPSPPTINAITHYPGWPREHMERAIVIPIEIVIQGIPGLAEIRSLSIFWLIEQ